MVAPPPFWASTFGFNDADSGFGGVLSRSSKARVVQSEGEKKEGRNHSLGGVTAVFIDGISEGISHTQLKDLFSRFGKVSRVFHSYRLRPGRRWRLGFAHMCFVEDAAVAIS